ncbi:MAG: hypothetical protein UY58_C0014G0006, partial [Candidatus Magasanikbacteria bacterium GW2011_GWA2_50_22]
MIGGVLKPRLRKRVVTIFVIAVLFPCLFLGYLGLKSIKQEKQWQQHASHIAALRTLSTHSFLVQGVFFLDNNVGVVFPKTFRDADVDEMKDRSTLRLQESEYLSAGDLFEVQGKLDEALTEYQRGFSSRLSKPLQSAFLSRIARCQFKKTDYENARKTYQRIIDTDHNQFYGEGMPYVLVAHLQLLEIAEENGSSLVTGNQLLDFYKLLVVQFDKCERAQYGFFLNQVKSRLERQQR